MHLVVPIAQAEASAQHFLDRVSNPDAIRLLIDRLRTGTFDGRRKGTCFFGSLAEGSGYSFSNRVSHERTLGQFLRNFGAKLEAGELHPIEFFCLGITLGMTPANNERAFLLEMWCRRSMRRWTSVPTPEYADRYQDTPSRELVTA